MSYLPDDAKLNELSIPGAHDATACNTESEIYGDLVAPFAQTQNQYIWGLLTSGTRYFDLRINKYGDDLAMCHGSIDMYDMEGNRLLLDSVLDDMQNFLGKHDGETLILQIKCDGDNCDPEIYEYFENLMAEQPDLIYCGDHVPTLGEARGRLVILSRLHLIGGAEGESETVSEYTSRRQRLYQLDDGTYWAFDVGRFSGGDTKDKFMALTAEFNGTEVWTEDMYDVPKWEKNVYVSYSLLGHGEGDYGSASYRKSDARDRGGDAWSIIYSSMSYQNAWGAIEDVLTFGDIDDDLVWPFQGADYMNPILNEHLTIIPSLYTGCLVGDFYDEEFVRRIYGSNFMRVNEDPWNSYYEVQFDSEGGSAVGAQQVFFGEEAARPADPTRENYKFEGWYELLTNADEFDFTTPIKGNVTLHAKWTEISTLTFDLNGGTLDGKTGTVDIQAGVGSTISILPAPTREGYKFTYWQGSEYYPGDSYEVTGNHTFTAQWEEVSVPSDDGTPSDDEGAPSGTSSDDEGPDTTKAGTPGANSSTSASSTAVPQTGDDSHLVLWGILMAASVLAISAAVFLKKRRVEDR